MEMCLKAVKVPDWPDWDDLKKEKGRLGGMTFPTDKLLLFERLLIQFGMKSMDETKRYQEQNRTSIALHFYLGLPEKDLT